MNDWELIQNYCRNGSESAFETLVKRHVDYVYCAALRQVRDPSLAEDVSQAVFMLLAQKAKTFRSDTILVSWLFRTTQFIAGRALRSEHRRQRRELEAAKMNPTTTMPESDHQWERVSPVLDEALAALPHKDRDAILLRFISRKPFSQVGAEIGVSEDAAKKRVSRALSRLREFFTRRGTTLSVAVLSAMLGERAVQAAPAALTAKITASLGAGASVASTPAAALLKTTLRDLFWRNVKWGAAISATVITALVLTTTAIRSAHNQAAFSTPVAPVAQPLASIDSKSPAPDASIPDQNLTTNHTLSLLVLRSEDRQPVSGAHVLVDSWVDSHRQRMLDTTTDRNGMLAIPIPNQGLEHLAVWISAEGRVPMNTGWRGYEINEPVISHTLLLEPGQTATGTIVDESGKPVPGAKVNFWGPGSDTKKRDNPSFHPELSTLLTDANGRWTTTQLPALRSLRQVSIRVSHPDFAPTDGGVTLLPGFPTNALVTLSNGVALTGRVLAADGTPIPNARASGGNLNAKTDANGFFFWPHLQPGQVWMNVEAEGFDELQEFIWATNAGNECTFALTPSSQAVPSYSTENVPRVRLHGTVVDADTGEPIPSFRVLQGEGYMMPNWSGATLPGAQWLGEGRDGQFDWKGIPIQGSLRLQVEAEGYLASVSDERNYTDADGEFTFKLRPAATLTGRVVTSDGSAVENADVTLTGPNLGGVMQSPGQLIAPNPGFESARTKTDLEGKFHLQLRTGARGFGVIHKSGFALVPITTMTNDPIVLQPWGAVEGTVYLNGQPAPNQQVMVTSQKIDADPRVYFFLVYTTNTDDHGHFRFDQVLPGEHSVSREVGYFDDQHQSIANSDHAAPVKVQAGAVASVDLRRQGRPIIGRIVFPGSPDDIDWGDSEVSVQGTNKFPFALSKDGLIRADDVPPGKYTLSIQLQVATVNPQMFAKTFGSLKKEIIVPTAEDETVPVNLGNLTIERAK